MLDLRGKKKVAEWELWDAGEWLPRSPLGATRHCSQAGLKVTEQGRYRQRKVYPTIEAVKKALLSMLPKRMRNLEVETTERKSYGSEEKILVVAFTVSPGVNLIAHLDIKKNGYSLSYAEDTIRTITREFRQTILHEEEFAEVRKEITEAKIFRTEQISGNGRIYPKEAMEKFLAERTLIPSEFVESKH